MSRQYEWQKRQKEKGLCSKCNNPGVKWGYCQKHLEKYLIWLRARAKKKKQFGKMK